VTRGKARLSYLVTLRDQIGHGSDEVKLLTAELLTLHALPLSNLKATTKRERIGEILSWMSEPVPLPAEVSAAFEQSSWNGGHGAHSMIWKWLADAASFVRSWWDLPEAERVQALNGPWKWLTVIHATPGMPMLRGTLLYLAFPLYFLPIISCKSSEVL
jgi:5-methylcytosine-specific restriction enzyme B